MRTKLDYNYDLQGIVPLALFSELVVCCCFIPDWPGMSFSGLMQLYLNRADDTMTASCPKELVFPIVAPSPVQGNRSKATPPRLRYEENCILAKEPDIFCLKLYNKGM